LITENDSLLQIILNSINDLSEDGCQ
jgi:hypothetical protein